MNQRKLFTGIAIGLVAVLVLIGAYFLLKNKDEKPANVENKPEKEYVVYKSSEYSPEFIYPKYWGEVTIKEGSKTCPKEDTYRTADTLSVFEWEYAFSEKKLPGSESFIRTGVPIHEINPKKLNACGDDFLLKIAQKKVDPATISSVMLNPLTSLSGLDGMFNPEASRLNTEGRVQYTFFVTQNSRIYVLQPYTSFVPNFESPELKELDEVYKGDMKNYLNEGQTAENIREHMQEFMGMANTLKFVPE
ncbi:MAG: hypothetical protein M3Q34_02200 [bacterium]|nr:hypothetical protein [bacterium]